GGKVRDETNGPKQCRDDQRRAHCPEPPSERAAKLRPHFKGGWVGKHPIEKPWPAKMEDRKNACTDHRKKRQSFGKAVDRRSKVVQTQNKNGGKEAAAVGHSDPPNVIGEIEPPNERNVRPPNTDTYEDEHAKGVDEQRNQDARPNKRGEPAPTKIGRQRYAGDFRCGCLSRCRHYRLDCRCPRARTGDR